MYKFRVVSIYAGGEDVKGFNSLLVYSVLINFRHSFIFIIENKLQPTSVRSLVCGHAHDGSLRDTIP